MGIFTFSSEIKVGLPPAKLFKAYVLDGDNLFPKVVPQAFKSIEILEGDGGVGTIKQINFGEASPFRYVKHKIDSIDNEKFEFGYSIIEGDVLGENVEKISYETKIVADGSGSIWKSTGTYYTKGDYVIEESQVKEAQAKAGGLFTVVEAYVLANPDAY